jgi:hypothetical protein
VFTTFFVLSFYDRTLEARVLKGFAVSDVSCNKQLIIGGGGGGSSNTSVSNDRTKIKKNAL